MDLVNVDLVKYTFLSWIFLPGHNLFILGLDNSSRKHSLAAGKEGVKDVSFVAQLGAINN